MAKPIQFVWELETEASAEAVWALFGERIAILVSGSVYERYLMMFFAALTVIFVGLAIASS